VQREWPLVGGFLAVVLIALLVAAVVPGVIAQPESDERDSLHLRDISVSHGTVTGETVPLSVEARVQHAGGPSENVTVLFRAVGIESGLVETTDTVDVGTVEDDREVPVTADLRVNRTGGYRIDTVVYRDGERRSSGSTAVEGVGNLVPQYADSNVDFHRFAGGPNALPSIEYSIESTTDERTTLNVSTYLTNGGDTPSEDMRLVLKARQADSNILAAERVVRVGQISPGSTETPTTTLTVPAEYNYYLDAVLWKEDVIVTTARSAANLNPTETIEVNQTRREVGLQVGDFQRGSGSSDGPAREPGETPTTDSSGDGPGFGPGLALAGILGGLFVLARRGDLR
jgi:PGF-CTERM protein